MTDMDSKFLVRIIRGYSKISVEIRIFTIISCLKTECRLSPEKYGSIKRNTFCVCSVTKKLVFYSNKSLPTIY